jgi:hypothetical protein
LLVLAVLAVAEKVEMLLIESRELLIQAAVAVALNKTHH